MIQLAWIPAGSRQGNPARDYFTVDTVFLKRLFVLFFLELDSIAFFHPTTRWGQEGRDNDGSR